MLAIVIAKNTGLQKYKYKNEQLFEEFNFQGALKGKRVIKVLIYPGKLIKFNKGSYYSLLIQGHFFHRGILGGVVLKYRQL